MRCTEKSDCIAPHRSQYSNGKMGNTIGIAEINTFIFMRGKEKEKKKNKEKRNIFTTIMRA